MSVVERFANPEGRSTIRYYEDGAKIVTGGPDGGNKQYVLYLYIYFLELP